MQDKIKTNYLNFCKWSNHILCWTTFYSWGSIYTFTKTHKKKNDIIYILFYYEHIK